jgi:cysteine sulfinate desulfinase/cysteine desulfurase-like protein
MGLTTDEAFSSVRFSFSVMNNPDEIAQATEIISKNYNALQHFAK